MRKVEIVEAHELREAVFARLLKPPEYSEFAAQHDVWPCVRKGVGERWLSARGEYYPPPKSAGLYFLRGHSAEAAIMGIPEDDKFVELNGVAGHPDCSREDLYGLVDEIAPYAGDLSAKLKAWLDTYPGLKFGEIKSTNYSSHNWYKLVQRGVIKFDSNEKFPMKNYIEQCGNYSVPLRSPYAVLIVYFLHGDYADRRSKCPECGNALGDWVDDFYRECMGCGYKSKKIDLWAYLLKFDDATRAEIRNDVYHVRRDQFYEAREADTEQALLVAAPGTPNHYCLGCKVGERLNCEYFGRKFD